MYYYFLHLMRILVCISTSIDIQLKGNLVKIQSCSRNCILSFALQNAFDLILCHWKIFLGRPIKRRKPGDLPHSKKKC